MKKNLKPLLVIAISASIFALGFIQQRPNTSAKEMKQETLIQSEHVGSFLTEEELENIRESDKPMDIVSLFRDIMINDFNDIFGGMYIDSNGYTTIALTDMGRKDVVEAYLRKVKPEYIVRFKEAELTLDELHAIGDKILANFEELNIKGFGVNEKLGKIMINPKEGFNEAALNEIVDRRHVEY